MNTELYDNLGVDPNSSTKDIKRAFLKKAKRFYPEKMINEEPDNFPILNEAYQILKDPEKRAIYDKYGHDAAKKSDSFYESTFDSQCFFNNPFTSNNIKKTKDIFYLLNITLEDLYKVKEVNLQLKRKIICNKCKGTGIIYQEEPIESDECIGDVKKCACTQCLGNK